MIIAQNPHLFCYLCKLAYSLRTLPIKFDPISSEITLEIQTKKFRAKCRYYFAAFLTATVALQCFLKRNSTLMESVIAWNSLAFLLIGHAFVRELRLKPDEIRSLFKSLFQINFILPNKQATSKTPFLIRVNVVVVYGVLFGAPLLPIGFAHGLHWANPCKPALAGYWFIPKCHSKVNPELGLDAFVDYSIQFLVIMLNHWLWSVSLHAPAFAICGVTVLVVVAIKQFIQRLEFFRFGKYNNF